MNFSAIDDFLVFLFDNYNQLMVGGVGRAKNPLPRFSRTVWKAFGEKPMSEPRALWEKLLNGDFWFSLAVISRSTVSGKGWRNRAAGASKNKNAFESKQMFSFSSHFSLQTNKKRKFFVFLVAFFSWIFSQLI